MLLNSTIAETRGGKRAHLISKKAVLNTTVQGERGNAKWVWGEFAKREGGSLGKSERERRLKASAKPEGEEKLNMFLCTGEEKTHRGGSLKVFVIQSNPNVTVRWNGGEKKKGKGVRVTCLKGQCQHTEKCSVRGM